MNVEEYHRMSSESRGTPWIVPEDFFKDGEFDVDLMLSTLEVFGYIVAPEDGPLELTDKLKLDLPDVYDLLRTIINNEQQARLDMLTDAGMIEMGLSEDGEAKYYFTKSGAEYVNGLIP
ncbi:hypothetical protein SEA_NICEHOUSE_226 [Rhodococcus phage NiceHouse]|nr:hypothetical protein SEA_NICEHOUSE_226 [Rhodococcus phage NiceHouse]